MSKFGIGKIFNKVENIAEDFGEGAVFSGVQTPIDGITQLVNKASPVDLPVLHIIDAPDNNSLATKLGMIAGTVADYAIISTATGGAGLAAGGLLTAGVNGAILAATRPSSEDGSFVLNKARDIGISTGTMVALQGTGQVLGNVGILGNAGSRSLVQDVAVGTISGGAGGIANAEMNALLYEGRLARQDERLSDAAEYAIFGGLLAAVSHVVQANAKRADTIDERMKKWNPDKDATLGKLANEASQQGLKVKTIMDEHGRVERFVSHDGETSVSYDSKGGLRRIEVESRIGIKSIYQVEHNAAGNPYWRTTTRRVGLEGWVASDFESNMKQFNGSWKLDPDGLGLTKKTPFSEIHLRKDAEITKIQTPEQRIAEQEYNARQAERAKLRAKQKRDNPRPPIPPIIFFP